MVGLIFVLDEMCSQWRFVNGFGDSVVFAELDAFEQPCHIFTEGAHSLETFEVFADIIRNVSVYGVPVL